MLTLACSTMHVEQSGIRAGGTPQPMRAVQGVFGVRKYQRLARNGVRSSAHVPYTNSNPLPALQLRLWMQRRSPTTHPQVCPPLAACWTA